MDQGAAGAKRLLHGVIDAKILEAKLSVTSDAHPKPAASKVAVLISLLFPAAHMVY